MRKELLAGALAALALGFGCASDKGAQTSPADADEYVPQAEEARQGAPTVYDDSATGGSGTDESVTTGGETWDTMPEPRGDEPEYGEEGTEAGQGGSGLEAESELIEPGEQSGKGSSGKADGERDEAENTEGLEKENRLDEDQ